MMRITVAPEWEWLLVWYFFLGGLAAGLYFMAALIELVGSERDRAMAKVAYYCTFPLAVVCGMLLILDLGRRGRSSSSAAWHSSRLWVCWPKTDVWGWGAGVRWPTLYAMGRSGNSLLFSV